MHAWAWHGRLPMVTVGRGDLLGRMGSTPHGRPDDEGHRPLSGERGEPGRLITPLVAVIRSTDVQKLKIQLKNWE